MAKETDPSLTLPFAIIHRFGPAPIVFPFPLAPQRVEWNFEAPVSLQRTAGGVYLNDFSGPNQMATGITIRGTFGYMPSVGVVGFSIPVPGSLSLKIFETTFETFNALDRQRKKDLGAVQEMITPSRLHYWRVTIRKFNYVIDKGNPLLYFYTIVADRLVDYLSPVGLASAIGGAVSGLGDSLGGLLGGGGSAGSWGAITPGASTFTGAV